MTESTKSKRKTAKGQPYPLGYSWQGDGVNFSLAAPRALAVTLCLFDDDGQEEQISLRENTDGIWHIWVANITGGQRYGYRVDGESDPARGVLFNRQKLLLDPYARKVDGQPNAGDDNSLSLFQINNLADNGHVAPKSVVLPPDTFDWTGDKHPDTPWDKTILYELHVKGFSQQKGDISARGSFAGIAQSVEYFKQLGITAVELLPITYHADEPFLQKQGKTNYWGYNVMAHFAPDPRFASGCEELTEFKQLVKTLHAAGIEVILDVVFNHSAENGLDGITLCQRGIDNCQYYFVDEEGKYLDFTGCGNSFNLNNPYTLRWVMDCLRYWVEECHVDGFRFDLAATLGRTPDFSPIAPFFAAIGQDPVLSRCKMIAEPWDIGWGGYNIGKFPQHFSEWNGKFRDDLRTFWLQEKGDLAMFATRFAGSSDIFQQEMRKPRAAINFITAHDGFTLCDLTSYNEKHNQANGEDNRDGESHNLSFNHGVEGKTEDPTILKERGLSARALLASLLLAHGVPMLLAGDEFGHSQGGNNNVYCQDNPTAWLNWAKADVTLRDYVQQVIWVRKHLAAAGVYQQWWHAENTRWMRPDGQLLAVEDWHNPQQRALMLMIAEKFLVLFNGNRGVQDFVLPTGAWQFLLDSGFTKESASVRAGHLGVCVLTTENETNHHDLSEKTA